jgi:hypothetical protein
MGMAMVVQVDMVVEMVEVHLRDMVVVAVVEGVVVMVVVVEEVVEMAMVVGNTTTLTQIQN